MPDYRKPPIRQNARAGAGSGTALPPEDSGPFSIETTTMRLKSLRLQRAENGESPIQEKLGVLSRDSLDLPSSPGPSGRVRHDERGVAVWDWAVATGEFAKLSATNVMRKLDLGELSIEETQRAIKAMKPVGRDAGGGGDPYNTRGAGKRTGEAAQRQGVTGSPNRPRPGSVLAQLTGKK
jgi:hypothetical protein